MIIFIGGPPRVGKSTIAKQLAKKTDYSWISTDNLRESVIYSKFIPKDHPLRTLVNLGKWDKQQEFYNKYPAGEIINFQNTESEVVAKLVRGFVKSIDYYKRDYILEGVALLPTFYTKAFLSEYNIKFTSVGNQNYKTFSKFSWKHRSDGDWLTNAKRETFDKVIRYCADFSLLFEKESNKHKIPYQEIRSETFTRNVNSVADKIINKL